MHQPEEATLCWRLVSEPVQSVWDSTVSVKPPPCPVHLVNMNQVLLRELEGGQNMGRWWQQRSVCGELSGPDLPIWRTHAHTHTSGETQMKINVSANCHLQDEILPPTDWNSYQLWQVLQIRNINVGDQTQKNKLSKSREQPEQTHTNTRCNGCFSSHYIITVFKLSRHPGSFSGRWFSYEGTRTGWLVRGGGATLLSISSRTQAPSWSALMEASIFYSFRCF